MTRADDEDAYDVTAEAESAKQQKHAINVDSGTPKYSIIKGYFSDPTRDFAALREYTAEDQDKNMLRTLAKTLMMDTMWTIDMGDPTLPPKHMSQFRRWILMDPEPTTTCTITPVEIAGLSLSEIRGNPTVPSLPGMPKEDNEWY